MSRIIDLTVPIEDHFRWKVDRSLKADFAKGDEFQITHVGLAVHGFTHIDSPRHMLPEGATSSEVPLEATIGEAAIIDISDAAPLEELTAKRLAARGEHVRPGDIAVLKTCWDEKRRLHDPAFWRDSPYLNRDACEWLKARGIKALAVDFPQDYPIRGLLDGTKASIEDFVSHDVLLRQGVILIEYICNLGAVRAARPILYGLPIRIPNSDGAPARVIAVEPA
jgi:arylformamidase